MKQVLPISELTATLRQLISIFHSDAQRQNPDLNSKTINRTVFFAVTRILLFKLWKDAGIIHLKQISYAEINQSIELTLKETFGLIDNGKSWLFNRKHNYTWYHPQKDALDEVLKSLSQFNLNNLHSDILGPLYESHIERVSRKNKGQYYTPPEIISFIWDRVGFKNPDDLFRYENGKRKPKLIFDPAVGSGGFLVEAAQRLVSSIRSPDDFPAVRDAITQGFYGSEIKSFPHYIAEVNLLIQLTPIVKKLNQIEMKSI